jgi:hypothetical protein
MGSSLAIQKVSYEGALVRGEAFSAAEEIEKKVPVFDKDRAEHTGRCCDRKFASVLLRTVAAAMIE